MGIKSNKTDRMFFKHEDTLLKELYKLNKFSKHLRSGKLDTKEKIVEQMQLQALCISELGRVVQEETGMHLDKTIKGMEFIFEKTKKKWNGQNSMYFYNRLENPRRLTSYNVANMLKRVCNKEFGIELRIVKNHRHYMSNGYKEILRKGLIW